MEEKLKISSGNEKEDRTLFSFTANDSIQIFVLHRWDSTKIAYHERL